MRKRISTERTTPFRPFAEPAHARLVRGVLLGLIGLLVALMVGLNGCSSSSDAPPTTTTTIVKTSVVDTGNSGAGVTTDGTPPGGGAPDRGFEPPGAGPEPGRSGTAVVTTETVKPFGSSTSGTQPVRSETLPR